MSLALMPGLASNAFATKWVFRSIHRAKDGKLYAIEECVRRFLSTDGCTVGSQPGTFQLGLITGLNHFHPPMK